MGRKSKSRRERRRERQAEEAVAKLVASPSVDRPVNWDRLRQVFGTMSHRGTKIFPNHVLSPVVVDASTPEEADAKTDQALVDAAKKQEPS